MPTRTVLLFHAFLLAGCSIGDADRESPVPGSRGAAPGSPISDSAAQDSAFARAQRPGGAGDQAVPGMAAANGSAPPGTAATPAAAEPDPANDAAAPDDIPGLGEFFHARAVGVITFELVDPTRSVPAVSDGTGSDVRSLVTDVLYPAQPRSADPKGRDRMADQDAPLDLSGAPYPLVIFVHGSLSDRKTSRSLQRSVARAGYIVVAADFPLTSINSREGISDAHAEDEIGDVIFLAGQMMLMNTTPDQFLDGAIDPDRYMVVGHSSGATVALVAQLAPLVHDDRMLGAIAMAPATCFLGDELFQTRSLPLLVLAGTNDHIVPYADNTERPYALVSAPKVLASFAGGKHAGFTDLDIDEDLLGLRVSTERSALGRAFAAYGVERTCAPIRDAERSGDRSMRFEEQHRRTAEWTVAFLDRVLYGASSALTSLEAAGDGAVVVQHDGI